jgi:hypothetical protein
MTSSENKSELAVKDGDQLPAEVMQEMFEDAGAGQEDMQAEDMQIPRLTILQALSPQCDKAKGEYIEGSESGMVINSVTLDMFDGDAGIFVIPVSYRKTYMEWKLRENNGGGLVADHGNEPATLDGCEKDEKSRMVNSDGNQIVVTAEYFVFLVDPETGAANPAVISMSSTQLKHSRRWNTTMNQLKVQKPDGSGTFNPAMFYRSYRMQTMPESNQHGSWFGWKISGGVETVKLPDGIELYKAAKAFRDQVSSGDVKVHEAQSEDSADPEDDGAPM